jgi:hypothetical protein
MSAPTLDRPPATDSASTGRRRRPVLLLVAAALVLATAVGTSLAIATRPDPRQAPAEPAASAVLPEAPAADQAAEATPGQRSDPTPAGEQPSGPRPTPDQPQGGSGEPTPVLADGTHQAYITKVDSANDRIVVDVVQVFHDDAAVKAAIADGRSREQAQYLTTWVRNQNPRLRTLPLAGGLVVQLRDACDEPAKDRGALLTTLADNASQKGTYYYTLAVADGKVQRITENLAIHAC